MNEIAKAAFSGTASKKMNQCSVVVDPITGQYLEVIGVSGINCANPAFAPDHTMPNNQMIKGD